MKNLPLLLLGAGAVYFIAKKPAVTKTEKDNTVMGQIGSKDVGYKIVNSKLTIYNKQKALDYAYKLGADNTLPDYNGNNTYKPLKNDLIGNALDNETNAKILMSTKENALFIFDLLKYLWSGMASKSQGFSEGVYEKILSFENSISSNFGYDTTDFKVEVIKK